MDGNATIREDEHGFWSVKFNARQPASLEPYISPCDISQVWNMWQNTEETLVNVSDLYSTTRSLCFPSYSYADSERTIAGIFCR